MHTDTATLADPALAKARTPDSAAEVTLREDERQRCEVWTRVMGYHRPVASFNTGKKGEFAERLHFQESCACLAQVA